MPRSFGSIIGHSAYWTDSPVEPGDDSEAQFPKAKAVIASAAKQSIAQQARKQEWIASSQGLLAMTLRQMGAQ